MEYIAGGRCRRAETRNIYVSVNVLTPSDTRLAVPEFLLAKPGPLLAVIVNWDTDLGISSQSPIQSEYRALNMATAGVLYLSLTCPCPRS